MTMLISGNIFDREKEHLTTGASEHEIYFGPNVYDAATGLDMIVEVVVTTAMTDSSSNSTMTVTIETKDEGESYATVATVGTFAALSAVGTKLPKYKVPAGIFTKSYARLMYTVADGNLTTGKFDAHIVYSESATKNYSIAV